MPRATVPERIAWFIPDADDILLRPPGALFRVKLRLPIAIAAHLTAKHAQSARAIAAMTPVERISLKVPVVLRKLFDLGGVQYVETANDPIAAPDLQILGPTRCDGSRWLCVLRTPALPVVATTLYAPDLYDALAVYGLDPGGHPRGGSWRWVKLGAHLHFVSDASHSYGAPDAAPLGVPLARLWADA